MREIDWVSEVRYQINRLIYVIKTPRVVREAESQLRKDWIRLDLEEEADELWD